MKVLSFIAAVVVLMSAICAASSAADFDNSGKVDILDLLEFADSWLDSGAIPENLDGVDTVNLADFAIFSTWWLQNLPPAPDPMSFAVVPHATGADSITMTATTATHAAGVEYYFTCTSAGGHDSGWQLGTSYTDTDLADNTIYTYTVKSRDLGPAQVQTAPSDPASARTYAIVEVELLDNGGFEIGTVERGDPFDCESWTRNPADGGADDNLWLADSPTEPGGQSIRTRWGGIEVYQDVAVEGAKDYSFSVDTYQTPTNKDWGPALQVTWFDGGGAAIGSKHIVAEIAPADWDSNDGIEHDTWYTISGEETAPANAATVRVYLLVYRPNGTQPPRGQVYFDNASVTTLNISSGPTPDPMSFAVAPYAVGPNSIAMTATTATHLEGVEYYFTCTAGGGHDSDWQSSTSYTDTGLSGNTTYTYTVKARDLSPAQIETIPSDPASARTLTPYETELLLNGDFEDGTPTGTSNASFTCANWTKGAPTSSNLSLIDYQGDNTIWMRWEGPYIYQEVSVDAGYEYVFSVDVYDPSTDTTRWDPVIVVEYYDVYGVLVGAASTIYNGNIVANYVPASAPNAWTTLSGNIVIPEGIATVRYILRVLELEHGRGGTYYFDNASLYKAQVRPIPEDDYVMANIDQPFTLAAPGILSNDYEAESRTLTVSTNLVPTTSHGSLTLNSDGSLTYVPDPGFSGTDSFTYKPSNGIRDGDAATVTIDMLASSANTTINDWTYTGSTPATMVSAVKLAGQYAVADSTDDRIEIRGIRDELLHTITSTDITAVAPWADLSGNNYGPCGMGFTPSGRQLFIAVCGSPSSTHGNNPKDAVLAYSLNLKTLRLLDQVDLAATRSDASPLGMLHYKGQLFVGTADNTVLRYQVQTNDQTATPYEVISVPGTGGVRGMAIDIWDEQLYVCTETKLSRIEAVTTTGGVADEIYSSSNLNSITLGRSYGGEMNGGLYILKGNTTLLFVPAASLQMRGPVTAINYETIPSSTEISATACGRMMLAASTPKIMSDDSDTRLDFEAFLQDEFDAYATYAKMAGSHERPDYLSGWLTPNVHLVSDLGATAQNDAWSDNAGWTFRMLVAADIVNNDPYCRGYILEGLKRWTGLHEDGIAPEISIDSWPSRQHDPMTGEMWNNGDNGGLFSIQALLYGIHTAKQYYQTDTELLGYIDYMHHKFRRSGDYLRFPTYTLWRSDNLYGPALPQTHFSGWDETKKFWQIGAAESPAICGSIFSDFITDRASQRETYQLINEPVINYGGAAFTYQNNYSYDAYRRQEPAWVQEYYNMYSACAAWTDDHFAPYLTVFSAGGGVEGYNGDGLSEGDHVGNIIHFPGVFGFCQFGDTYPAVGAYMAYREGRRVTLEGDATDFGGSPNEHFDMLTRFYPKGPDKEFRLGFVDCGFGMMGLLELLSPGAIDQYLAIPFYRDLESEMVNGTVKLSYSEFAPRRVLAMKNGEWLSFGFHRTPFYFDDNLTYDDYKVEDPEGELLDLNNANFENNLDGWTTFGDYLVTADTTAGRRISGTSLNIKVESGSTSNSSGVTQTLDVSTDFEDTEYIIRADAFLYDTPATAAGYLRAEWDNDNNPGNGIIGSAILSNAVDAGDTRAELRIDTTKPATANYVHLSLLVQKNGDPGGKNFYFDNFSVVRIGALMPLVNGDFETGNLNGWAVTDTGSNIAVTTDPAKVQAGSNSVLFSLPTTETAWQRINQDLDISGDPAGTRYIVKLKAKGIDVRESYVRVEVEFRHSDGTYIRSFAGIEHSGDTEYFNIITSADHVFAARKYIPDPLSEDILRFNIEMDRLADSENSGNEEVVFDEIRIYKEFPTTHR